MGMQHVSGGTQSGVTAFAAANFAAREAFRPAYDRVADAMCAALDFASVLDVGCGQGFLIDALLARGVDVQGIEVSPDAKEMASPQAAERISIGNALYANASKKFDAVACIEVAEHIEPDQSQALVGKLCALAERYVFFTAATPYQPGHGHINCRPTTDWIHWFDRRQWKLDIDKTMELRVRIGTANEAPWISMNTMLFVKE